MFNIVLLAGATVASFGALFGWMAYGPTGPAMVLPGLMGVGFLYLTAEAIDQRQRAMHSRKASVVPAAPPATPPSVHHARPRGR